MRTLYIQMAAQATVSYLVVVWKMGMVLPLVSTLVQFWVGLAAFRSWKLAQIVVPSAALYLHPGWPHPPQQSQPWQSADSMAGAELCSPKPALSWFIEGEPVAGALAESRQQGGSRERGLTGGRSGR